jgi:MFS transporter, PPP family, 3-phenylpropionic acid transporter
MQRAMTDTAATTARPTPGTALRLSLYFAAVFTVTGASLPYLNLWLAHVGLSIGEIAVIATVTPLVRMIAGPLASLAADMTRAHRMLLIICSWGWAGAWLLQSGSTTFRTALLAQTLIAVAAAGLSPLIEAIAVSSVRAYGIDYGRVRVWGSIAFIGASIAGGWLVDWRGIGAVIWLLFAGAVATAMAGHLLPRLDGGVAAGRRIGLADTLALIRKPEFLLFLLATGLAQSAHATLYVFSVIHWKSLGLSNGWCGALWAVSVMVEIAIFIWGSTHLKRFSPVVLMLSGAIAAAFRWTLMALDPPLALLVPLQALHGLTYGAMHLGAIQFLTRAIPEEQGGTAQGLYALVTSGIFMALAAWIAGVFYIRAGGLAYLPMAGLAAGAIVALLVLRRRWVGGTIGDVLVGPA